MFTVLGSFLLLSVGANPKGEWPRTFSSADGSEIKIYSLQPESLQGNQLKAKAAISVVEPGKKEPVFGTTWVVATLTSEGNKREISSVKVPNLKLPEDISASRQTYLKKALESELPKLNISLSEKEIQERLNSYTTENKLQDQIKHNAPNIYYSKKPTMLVVIDGSPRLEKNDNWGVEFVVNTPYTIVRTNNRFYLDGGGVWYQAMAATGPYTPVKSVPAVLERIKKEIQSEQEKQSGYTELESQAEQNSKSEPLEVLVSTEPAELIQTKGEPQFVPIEGTELLFAENSGNDIFVDVSSQKYYVLLAGRWYSSSSGLKGQWKYTDPSELPSDFSSIPEDSPKDHVLASVPGTPAAREAIMDAQVPQTAKVDRQQAMAEIQYDGSPRFDDVEGTNLQYAQNTSATVLKYRNRYYAVDNGVWFEAGSPQGPWIVAATRPDEVDLIPPSSPVYNVKYVYIYDVTPTHVYMGYTPGYLNTFICGPTIVYGTGYYYRPWYGRHYFARPWTWGFNMWYNPWAGWSFGIDIHLGWFNTVYYNPWSTWCGGWWGPPVYRPPFGWYTRPRVGGYYGHAHYTQTRNTYININHTTNIYRNRTAIVTHDRHRVPDRVRNNWARADRNGTINRPGRNEGDRNGRPGINNGGRPDRNNGNQNGRPGINNGNRPDRNNGSQNGRPGINNGDRPDRNNGNQNGRPGINNGNRPDRNNGNQNGRPGINNGDRPDRNSGTPNGRPGIYNGGVPDRNNGNVRPRNITDENGNRSGNTRQDVRGDGNNLNRDINNSREAVRSRPVTEPSRNSGGNGAIRTERPVVRERNDQSSGSSRTEARPQQPTRRYEPSQNRSSGSSERRAPQRQENRNNNNQNRRNG